MRSDCKHKAQCGFKSRYACRFCDGEPWNEKCKQYRGPDDLPDNNEELTKKVMEEIKKEV